MENNFKVIFKKLEQANVEQRKSTSVDIMYIMKTSDGIRNIMENINSYKCDDYCATITRS